MSSDSDLSIICCYLFVIVLCYDLYCYCYSLWSLLRPLFFLVFVVSVVAMISFNLVICYWYSLFLLPSSCYLVVSYFLCYCSLSRSLLVLVIVLCYCYYFSDMILLSAVSVCFNCYQLFQSLLSDAICFYPLSICYCYCYCYCYCFMVTICYQSICYCYCRMLISFSIYLLFAIISVVSYFHYY